MYEMQGTLPGIAAQGPPVAWRFLMPRADRQSQEPARGSGFPTPPTSGVTPGQCPFLTVKAFLLPRHAVAQDLGRDIFRLFCCPQSVHRMCLVIRVRCCFSTALCTGHPQVTGRSPEGAAR